MSLTPSPRGARERRVSLVAVDSRWRDPNGTFYSFSYGVEKLRASIRSAPDLADVEVSLVDLRSNDPDEFFETVVASRPTLVGLSTYIWSLDVFAKLAERLRRFDPSIVIVAGGPAARRSVLDLAPHRAFRDLLDAIVPGEGEGTIRALVREHLEPDWKSKVPGLEIPGRGLWRTSPPAERPAIDEYPSPYQLDLGPRGKTGYIETFRGCPIHCAFCQWGEQKSDRVHGAEYLASHLEGLRRADVANVFFLDAAFNLSPRAFRNLVAAERQVNVLSGKTVHGHLYPTHLEDEHLELFDAFGQVQASVGIQSFDEEVLARVGRPFDVARFERVLARMRGRIDVDIELIFGLPGDSPESFWRTFQKSIALGDTVKVFRCLVLPDALLERTKEMGIDFDPRTFGMTSCNGWSADDLDREWARVVKAAEELGRPILNDDWVGFVVDPDTFDVRARHESIPEVRSSLPTNARRTAPVDESALRELHQRVLEAVVGWGLDGVREDRDLLLFDLRSPTGEVVLRVERLIAGARCFASRDGLAYSHQGALDRMRAPELRRVIDVVHGAAVALLPVEEHAR